MSDEQKPSKYLQYLPGIYQDTVNEGAGFLGQFLKAFEKMLSERSGEALPDLTGIEAILDQMENYFDPQLTPAQLLPWLASWVALTLKEGEEWYGPVDVVEKDQNREQLVPLSAPGNTLNRNLIGRIVQLYQKRGTKEGLEEYLKIYVGDQVKVSIVEYMDPFQIGYTSTVGVDTMIGQMPPYYFRIHMTLPVPDKNLLEKKRRALIEIIDREKPAHTYYDLIIEVPSMQINVHSTVGVDTLLGGFLK